MSATPYSPRLTKAISLSHAVASRQGKPHVGTEQLMLGLLGSGEGSALRMLASVGVTPGQLESQLGDGHGGYGQGANAATLHPFTAEAANTLYIASREADFWEAEKVETMHLLLALLRDENHPISKLFSKHGIEYQFLFDMAAYDRVGLRFA